MTPPFSLLPPCAIPISKKSISTLWVQKSLGLSTPREYVLSTFAQRINTLRSQTESKLHPFAHPGELRIPKAMRETIADNKPLPEDPILSPSTPGTSLLNGTSKKLKSHSSADPYPHFDHPTPEESREVYEILFQSVNGRFKRRSTGVSSTNTAATCGRSRNVVDSLIGTILSQNTSSRNSSTAKRSLDTRFGKNNFKAIAEAPLEDVVAALRCGGLANKKAATIQKLLRSIKAKHGAYSLQHLASVSEPKSSDEIMEELVSYDGVGPKTAACVLLFCIGRDSFAVDTHVFRLSKMLGWVPKNADRVKAQAHLDKRIPDELKYGLHVLMIRHGKGCRGCKREGSNGDCILKDWVNGRAQGIAH